MDPQTWVCGGRTFSLSTPLIMGVLNVTPDSFSDGGHYFDETRAVEQALRMARWGADIIDVGGESTRPGAAPVSMEEEISRVAGVIRRLTKVDIPVSIDSRNPAVVREALDAGACIINDISGFTDPEMREIAVANGAGVIVMHMQGDPEHMQDDPHYEDVVAEVKEFLLGAARKLEEAGLAPGHIAIDPGFGFGKTTEHNLELVRRTEEFVQTGYPTVVAVSRKGTIGAITGIDNPEQRIVGSVVASCFACFKGANIVRIHDVRAMREGLDTLNALVRRDRQ